MNVVDSSGWIEYLADTSNAEFFAPVLEDRDNLVVPTVSVVEVVRWVLRNSGMADALQVAAVMRATHVVALDVLLSTRAAKAGLDHSLPLADSVIFATAQEYSATLWTQDSHFQNIAGVQYQPKQRSG